DKKVKMIGVESYNSASIEKGEIDIIHCFKCYVLKGDNSSIAAGLDYPGIGPEHSYYSSIGRAKYVSVTDEEALEAFFKLSKTEGIIPAIESSHGISYGMKLAKKLPKDNIIIINLSGRGDKDVVQVKDIIEKK